MNGNRAPIHDGSPAVAFTVPQHHKNALARPVEK